MTHVRQAKNAAMSGFGLWCLCTKARLWLHGNEDMYEGESKTEAEAVARSKRRITHPKHNIATAA